MTNEKNTVATFVTSGRLSWLALERVGETQQTETVTYTGATVMPLFEATLALAAVTSRQVHTLGVTATGAQTFSTLVHI